MMKEEKEKCEKNFIETFLQLDPWGIPYKIVTEKTRSPTVFSSLKKPDGTYTSGWCESATTLLNSLLPEDKERNETLEKSIYVNRLQRGVR